jgi:hypothetical protein
MMTPKDFNDALQILVDLAGSAVLLPDGGDMVDMTMLPEGWQRDDYPQAPYTQLVRVGPRPSGPVDGDAVQQMNDVLQLLLDAGYAAGTPEAAAQSIYLSWGVPQDDMPSAVIFEFSQDGSPPVREDYVMFTPSITGTIRIGTASLANDAIHPGARRIRSGANARLSSGRAHHEVAAGAQGAQLEHSVSAAVTEVAAGEHGAQLEPGVGAALTGVRE